MVFKNENEQFPYNPNLIPYQFHGYGPKIQRKCDAGKVFKVASSRFKVASSKSQVQGSKS